MSSEKMERAEDLELTGREADRVKGGVLPSPVDGGGVSSRTVQTKKNKRKHRKHKGKH